MSDEQQKDAEVEGHSFRANEEPEVEGHSFRANDEGDEDDFEGHSLRGV